ncbi:hypothetical protein DSCO28_50490 [Desulfosarcina ovata subsp. sediminis]|uniref:Peptidase n=1 Tax=Desulfosarcina ovata subsp. sediminis TaxID=885957 RepID=A0A5K7ZW47_9BACT|nr:hypothetical protein [Desulfosarcina ovata]BBO84483.1 hypothetical protein DSCO28_50490 [Desulfosarcina ovata subsp. sediminis]
MTITFNGFDGWVEIFAGGPQTDSKGALHDGDRLIDNAVSTFDPGFHEPPAVVGHPQDDSPAYGMVSDVKSDTSNGSKVLLARFKDVYQPFAEMVQAGRFPKRSAAFYPDGRLRHVGFLGAMPPAVKGLKNIAFADGEAIAFEFEETKPTKEDLPMKFSEFLSAINIFKKMGGKDEDIDLIALPEPPSQPATGQFSEADVEAARKKVADETEARVRAEFAETRKKETKKQRDDQVAAWVETQVAAGVIPPAIRDNGLVTFMQNLPDEAITFAEGQENQSGLDWFKDFIATLGKNPLFSEIATNDAAGRKKTEAEAEVKLGKDIGERANR